jgi:hypothetical protein
VPEERRRATLLTLGLISTGVRIQVAVPADATLPAKGGLIVREPARAGTPPAAHIVGRNDRTVVIEVTATREEVEAGLVLELADPDGVAWPALKAVTADVIDLQVIDGATVVTIDAGTGDGLDREWTGTFLNADGKPVPGGSFRLVWVGPNRARLKVKLTPDQVRAAGRVRLEPPPT